MSFGKRQVCRNSYFAMSIWAFTQLMAGTIKNCLNVGFKYKKTFSSWPQKLSFVLMLTPVETRFG